MRGSRVESRETRARVTRKTLLLVLLLAAPAFAAELYPNDLTKDSAPGLQELLDNNEPLPAGAFMILSTLDSGTGMGGGCIGVGAPDFGRISGNNGGAYRDYPVTMIVDGRPVENTEPMLKIRRSKYTVDKIGFQSVKTFNHDQRVNARGKGPAIEITQVGATWPVGQTQIGNNVLIANSEFGIWHADNGNGGGHSDHTWARFTSSYNDYEFVTDDNQSVNHHVDIFVAGNSKGVVWAKQGGKIWGFVTTNDRCERLLILGEKDAPHNGPTKNNGYFNFDVSIDGGDSIGAFVEELKAYQYASPVVHINGFAADSADLGDPILLNEAQVNIRIERVQKPHYIFEANGK